LRLGILLLVELLPLLSRHLLLVELDATNTFKKSLSILCNVERVLK
jgi:hypothetical protein